MLVEKRRNRTTRANNTSRPTDAPLVSHSRFNPLFSGNDHGHTFDIPVTADSVEVPAEHSEPSGGVTAPFIEPAAESVLETLTDTPTSVHDLVFVPSGNKSKAKGKVIGVVRKHNPNVLGSLLNPEKHTALTLDPAAPPISAARNVQQSARLNVEPSSVNVDTVHAGCGSQNFLRVTKQYLRDYRPDVCVLVETRVSHSRADLVIESLRFPNSHRIEAIRFSGGIWLCWFDSVKITVLANQFQFVHCCITSTASSNSLQLFSMLVLPATYALNFGTTLNIWRALLRNLGLF
ncbi:hypothetical protein V6N13_090573 [Hibiscus sabdariffa]